MIQFREYQDRAHNELRRLVRRGVKRILLVSPTGSGKTVMLSRVVYGADQKEKRCAWFAHRRELLSQAAACITSFGVTVGVQGTNIGARCQIVGAQSALSVGDVPEADLVFLDEAHHYAADVWGSIPKAYPDALIIGATATPERGDGRPLDHIFDEMIVVAQPEELVASGALVPCETIRPPSVERAGHVSMYPAAAYQKYTPGRRAVVFAPHVEDANRFCQDFIKLGIPALVVTGEMDDDKRDGALKSFANGETRVLVNVFVLTEGWDCPPLDVVIIARKVSSVGMFMQMVGRGLRWCEGKSGCTLLDLTGITHIHGDPLEERVYSLDGAAGMSRKSSAGYRLCKTCGELLEDDTGPCPRCLRPRDALAATTESGTTLSKFARIRRDDEHQRAARLSKWIQECEGSGRNWKGALYRFSGTYGTAPPREITSRALALARGYPWCLACKHGLKNGHCDCPDGPTLEIAN